MFICPLNFYEALRFPLSPIGWTPRTDTTDKETRLCPSVRPSVRSFVRSSLGWNLTLII